MHTKQHITMSVKQAIKLSLKRDEKVIAMIGSAKLYLSEQFSKKKYDSNHLKGGKCLSGGYFE